MKRSIVFLGDPVGMAYLPAVKAALAAEADIWSPPEAVAHSIQLLGGLREWVLKRQPDLVYIAAGREDTRKLCFGENERLVPLPFYGRNVASALRLIGERSTAKALWATIAPVDGRRFHVRSKEDGDFGYDNETISLYNEEAKEVAARLGVEALDLYGFVKAAARMDSLRPDGLRFDPRANAFLADRVADWLRARLDPLAD